MQTSQIIIIMIQSNLRYSIAFLQREIIACVGLNGKHGSFTLNWSRSNAVRVSTPRLFLNFVLVSPMWLNSCSTSALPCKTINTDLANFERREYFNCQLSSFTRPILCQQVSIDISCVRVMSKGSSDVHSP